MRLPDKPLAMIGGLPMIVHVMRRAMAAGFGSAGSRVIVACDDMAIVDAVTAHGGEAIMTRADHPSGSDRVHEAIEAIDPDGKIDVIVNLQGDLPEIDAAILPGLVDSLIESGADIATPVARPAEMNCAQSGGQGSGAFPGGVNSPGASGRVLYFSRHPIPHGGDESHRSGIMSGSMPGGGSRWQICQPATITLKNLKNWNSYAPSKTAW